jgi:predicted RNA-binding protein (virulence factor B family)
MIEIGKYNLLNVLRHTSIGLYLGDNEGNDILLPNKYVPDNISVGDEIKVFVYKDSEDRIIATTLQPKITLHEFALLEVVMVNEFGAFLDWGLEKHLFVPFKEQAKKMEEGRFYIVFLYVDEKTDRLVASAKLNKFLSNEELTVEEGQEVDILIGESTDLGINVIINGLHKGLVYHNELFTKVRLGETVKGYIKKIREDNKIDVGLQKQGYENVEPNAEKILEKLKSNKGFLALTDNSSPEEILDQLEMSKKTFKKAIGLLYRNEVIRLEDKGIRLNKSNRN